MGNSGQIIGFDEAGDGFSVHFVVCGKFGLRRSFLKLLNNIVFLFIELMFFWRIWLAFRASEFDAFRFFSCKGFFGAHADEISLDFCGESESKSEYFTGNVITESVIVLDAPDEAAFFHTDAKNFHYHKKTPAQTGQFCANYYVSFTDTFEQQSETTFAVSFCTTYGFFNPSVNAKMLSLTETTDFEFLIFSGLLITADPYIAINHFIRPPFSQLIVLRPDGWQGMHIRKVNA